MKKQDTQNKQLNSKSNTVSVEKKKLNPEQQAAVQLCRAWWRIEKAWEIFSNTNNDRRFTMLILQEHIEEELRELGMLNVSSFLEQRNELAKIKFEE